MRSFAIAYALAALLLAGCAGTSDVVSTGADTYLLAGHGTMGWSSGGAQRAKVIQQAGDYCRERSKRVEIIESRDTGGGGFGKIASGEVEFRCTAP